MNVCDRNCRSQISLDVIKFVKGGTYKNRHNDSTFNVHIIVRALAIPSVICAEENHELSYIAVDENASLRGLKPRALA